METVHIQRVQKQEYSRAVHCEPLSNTGPVRGTLRQDRRTGRVTHGQGTIFVLGAYWALNPPITFFGVQTLSFGQIYCKTLQTASAEREVYD